MPQGVGADEEIRCDAPGFAPGLGPEPGPAEGRLKGVRPLHGHEAQGQPLQGFPGPVQGREEGGHLCPDHLASHQPPGVVAASQCRLGGLAVLSIP